jgi:hypothetical protein
MALPCADTENRDLLAYPLSVWDDLRPQNPAVGRSVVGITPRNSSGLVSTRTNLVEKALAVAHRAPPNRLSPN